MANFLKTAFLIEHFGWLFLINLLASSLQTEMAVVTKIQGSCIDVCIIFSVVFPTIKLMDTNTKMFINLLYWYASLTLIHYHVRGGISDIFRSSRPEVFSKKGVLKDFAKSTGQNMCQKSLFLRKYWPQPATLLKKRLWNMYFPVDFAKFLIKLHVSGVQLY